jgi:DNA replication protein DnaC
MNVIDTTDDLLTELKLHGLREALPRRLRELHEQRWSPSEFLNLCLEDERLFRQNARLARRLREATFPTMASLENLDFTIERKLDRSQVRELASASFVTQSLNILIAGPTGVGKTHLACALGNAACRQGFSTLFLPLNRLLEKMALIRAQGRYLSLLKKLTSVSVLIVDDWGLRALTPQQMQDIYDIVDGRVESMTTIITTQLPQENWNEILPDPVLCDAITDRIVQKAISLEMVGESYRKKRFRGGHSDPP